jgi:peptidoglycan/xylan/chitin deacetylase (PgdA/CDA1 family)
MDFSKSSPAQTESAPPAQEVRAWTMFLDATEAELVGALKPVMPTGRRLRPSAWPGNKRAALAVTFDVDNEWPMSAALPAQVGAGSYGWFEALPRIHRLLDREQVAATFYIPVGSALLAPGMVAEIKAAGRHEIGLHGWTHERVPELKGIEEERRLLEQQIQWYQREVGGFPRGYRAPNGAISTNTVQLLMELGIKYDSSIPGGDDCFELLSKGRETGMVEVPFSWVLTDWMYLHVDEFYQGNLQSPDEVYRVYRSELDLARAEGGLVVLTLHPHIIGRRSRISILERLIQDAKTYGDVWFATVEQIVAHVAKESGLSQRRARSIA